MEQFFAFRAYNSQTLYGYGLEKDADTYADVLNQGREVNHYHVRALSPDAVAELNLTDRNDVVNLEDELVTRANEAELSDVHALIREHGE